MRQLLLQRRRTAGQPAQEQATTPRRIARPTARRRPPAQGGPWAASPAAQSPRLEWPATRPEERLRQPRRTGIPARRGGCRVTGARSSSRGTVRCSRSLAEASSCRSAAGSTNCEVA